MKVTIDEAVALIRTLAAEPDADDDRKRVQWTWAFGPFGSWPETIEAVKAKLAQHADSLFVGHSMRVDDAILYKSYWGYAANPGTFREHDRRRFIREQEGLAAARGLRDALGQTRDKARDGGR